MIYLPCWPRQESKEQPLPLTPASSVLSYSHHQPPATAGRRCCCFLESSFRSGCCIGDDERWLKRLVGRKKETLRPKTRSTVDAYNTCTTALQRDSPRHICCLSWQSFLRGTFYIFYYHTFNKVFFYSDTPKIVPSTSSLLLNCRELKTNRNCYVVHRFI